MIQKIDIVGQIISGQHGQILVREKSGANIELGDLLVCEDTNANADSADSAGFHAGAYDASGRNSGNFTIMQVYDLRYGSQIPQQSMEMASGLTLEGLASENLVFMESNLRNYVLASLKALVRVEKGIAKIPKSLPQFFSSMRRIEESDLKFLSEKRKDPLFVGNIRSGSKMLNIPLVIDGEKALTHHIFIPATTGRGKSNLVKSLLWNVIDKPYCGMLVMDPHDEYYGRTSFGLKDHPKAKDFVVSYSPNPARGGFSLIINLADVKPWHFRGVAEFSDAQRDALEVFYRKFRKDWISEIFRYDASANDIRSAIGIMEGTLAVIQRKLGLILNMYANSDGNIRNKSPVFSLSGGDCTIKDIVRHIESGKKVIIDTSSVSAQTEILIGGIIANEIFEKYKFYKSEGALDGKPVASIILEEAPRVLSSEAMASGGNIFSSIAREGRKFKVGLIAVTQLSSIIPREILTNMNTKIILGNELASERQAIIESASQDLSTDSRSIASLDKGEAIVSSVFTKFAVPIAIPRFEDYEKDVLKEKEKELPKERVAFI